MLSKGCAGRDCSKTPFLDVKLRKIVTAGGKTGRNDRRWPGTPSIGGSIESPRSSQRPKLVTNSSRRPHRKPRTSVESEVSSCRQTSWGVAKLVRHRPLEPASGGSSPPAPASTSASLARLRLAGATPPAVRGSSLGSLGRLLAPRTGATTGRWWMTISDPLRSASRERY